MLQTFSKISLMCLALGMAQLVYSSADNTVVAQIDIASVTHGGVPYDLALTPDGLTLYIPMYTTGFVSFFSTEDNSYLGENSGGALYGPLSIAINPDGTFAYIGCQNGTVAVMNLDTNNIDTTITVEDHPYAIISNSDGSRVYTANTNSNSVSVIQTSDNTVIARITGFSGPAGLAITSNDEYIYVTNNTGSTVSVIETASNTIVGSPIGVQDGPIGISITPDDTFAYVANSQDNNVSIINLFDNTVTITSAVGMDTPTAVQVSSDGSIVYISNATTTGFISIFDTELNTFIGTVDNNSFTLNTPTALALVPNSPYMYTADTGGPTSSQVFTFITILAPATITGLSQSNVFFTQTDYINTVSWTAPESGTAPTSYNIYRNAGLTDLAGTVLATSPLVFYDHNRIPGVTYTYYVVSVDSGDIESSAISVSVTTKNN